MKELIRHILREETSIQKKLVSIINRLGFDKAISAVGGLDNFQRVMKDYIYLTDNMVEKMIKFQLDNIKEDSEDWGIGEMDQLDEVQSVDRIEVTNLVNVDKPKFYLTFYVEGNRKDYDSLRSEIQYKIKEDFGIELLLFIDEVKNINTFGPGIDW
jgi:hypothetical protein